MEISSVENVRLSEPLIILPDRKIKIVGTDHGQDEPFPGREHTEKEVFSDFNKLTALAIDSQPLLESYIGRQVIQSTQRRPNSQLRFEEWATKLGMEKGVPLIMADVAYAVDGLNDVGDREVVNRDIMPNSPYVKEVKESAPFKELEQNEAYLKEMNDKLNLGLSAGALGAAAIIAEGLIQRNKVSRRGFLTRLGVLGAAGVFALFGQGIKGVNQRKIVDISFDKNNMVLTDSRQMYKEDFKKASSRYAEPRELTEADQNSPDFQRRAELNTALNVLVILRNAIAADVLTLPLSTIIPGYDEKTQGSANIASIWGHDHLTINKKYSISELAKNEPVRRKAIEDSMRILFDNMRLVALPHFNYSRSRADEFVNNAKKQMKEAGRTYKLQPQGSFSIHHFAIPGVDAALAKIG